MSMCDEETKPEAGTTIAQSISLSDLATRIRAEHEAAGRPQILTLPIPKELEGTP